MAFMKNRCAGFKRVASACLAVLSVFALVSCSGSFKGYMKENLSKYIKMGSYKGISYTPYDTSVSDEDVERKIDEIMSGRVEEVRVTDRAVEKSDVAVLSYSCTTDIGKTDKLSVSNEEFEMWYTYNTVYESDIVASVIGKMPGETFEYSYHFPDDFVLPGLDNPRELMGKDAVFTVSVEYIKEESTPALTDEYVKSTLSPGCSTVSEYKEELRKELLEEKLAEADTEMKSELWSKVIDSFEVIKYPESELEYYKNLMYNAYEAYSDQNGYYSLEYFLRVTYGKPIEVFKQETEEYAENTVKELLVVYSIVKAEKISLSDDEYNAAAEKIAQSGGESASAYDIEKTYGKENIELAALREKVITLVVDCAEEGNARGAF